MNQEIKERIELINKGIVPAGYKKTSVGICPVEWKTYKIGNIAQVVGGGTPDTKNTKYYNGDINWFTPTEIGLTRYVSESKIKITSEGLKNSSAKIIPAGNILLTSRATIGDMSFNLIDCSTNQGFQSLIIKDSTLKNVVYFNNYKLKKQMQIYANGSTFLEISNKDVKKLKINISNKKEENSAIAKVLDCATRQVELQEQLVDKLKVQKKALMQKLLTPQPDWQEVKLGDICEDIYQPQTVPQKEFKNNGYKVYGANGFIGFYDKYNHKEWQVVLSCRGDCGTINKTEPESWINGNAMVLKMEGNELIDKNYFYYQCLATSFKDVIDNSGIPQITRTPLLKKNFRFIKNIKVQKKIANFFINIDKLIELKQKLLWQYKLRQKALMQLLLTGIVRVG